jgi:hypothetical protein
MIKIISYRGHTKQVPEGQEVYECNERTGQVCKADLVKVQPTISERIATVVTGRSLKPVYNVVEKKDHSCVIAASLYKACVKFKQVYSKTHVKVKFP